MPLADRSVGQEQWTARKRRMAELPTAYGRFIANLAEWNWFINPLTFRGEAPCSDGAMVGIQQWLADIDAHAGKPIGWLVAEEFGSLGGRWHCHGLISGVSHLQRKFWWSEAFRRFGRTRIVRFEASRAGAFYAAKYAAKALGNLHFGGSLAGIEISRVVRPGGGSRSWADSLASDSAPLSTHAIVSESANVEKAMFRLGLGRWHR